MDIFQFIGFAGMLCVCGAYLLLQLRRTNADSMAFQLINLAGAVLLIISLCVHFNLGSFLIEVFWICITIYGICKILKKGKNE